MPNAVLLEESKYVYSDSLKSLVLTLQTRVVQASSLIGLSDDLSVLEREIRFINPFWDFVVSRQTLNSTEYWEACSKTLLGETSYDLIRVTPLSWLPQRQMLVEALQRRGDAVRPTIHDLLLQVEGVVFNFLELMSRCSFLLNIPDAASFDLETWKRSQPEGYRLALVEDRREAADESGRRLLVGHTTAVTTSFVMPEGEAIRVERNYTQSPTNPRVHLRMLVDSGQQRTDDRVLTLKGTLSDIQNGLGRVEVE